MYYLSFSELFNNLIIFTCDENLLIVAGEKLLGEKAISGVPFYNNNAFVLKQG